MNTPEYKDLLGVHDPVPDYILTAWEKLHASSVVPDNFNFYLFERIGTDAIQLTGTVYLPAKNKTGWKPSPQKTVVIVTRREVAEFIAKQTAAPVDADEAVRRITAKVELLLAEASDLNVVVTIENRPLVPLAMGRYEMVADVRKGRQQ